ncbi:ribosomal protein L6P/L9E (apicoplast) [Babesia ovis]|uniref:Ribosomal protein L6P/L9E n=1 Tax=Babesia ovis TaxID=5869 RepID=A0A9W5TDH6_BABOV|nr:ribosomal protein L6P/L9E [Babesia ovis]
MIKYLKNYTNKHFINTKYSHVLDRKTNNVHMYLKSDKTKQFRAALLLNKFIFKTIFNSSIFCYKSKYFKFIMFIKSFISYIHTILMSLFNVYTINIQILSIFYKVILIKNKLILKINNFINIIVYISNLDQLNIRIQQSNSTLISVSSYNKVFISSLCSIIVNCKKFNVYTNTGIKYLNQKIHLKKILKLKKK